MQFTVSLGSAKTFKLFQEAKLKSGQSSDEEFIRQMLAENHGLYSRSTIPKDVADKDAAYTSRGTQVDVLDLITNADALPYSASELVIKTSGPHPLTINTDDENKSFNRYAVHIKPLKEVEREEKPCVFMVIDPVNEYANKGLQTDSIGCQEILENRTEVVPSSDKQGDDIMLVGDQELDSVSVTGWNAMCVIKPKGSPTLVCDRRSTGIDQGMVTNTYSEIDNNATIEEDVVNVVNELSDNQNDNSVEKNSWGRDMSSFEMSSDDQSKSCGTMFGCKQCLMYFSKFEKVSCHIQNVHSALLKDGSTCEDFVTEESTILGVKKHTPSVHPKVEFGMISEEEVIEAIQNQQEEIKEGRKRKLAEKKKKSRKPKEVLRCTECDGVFRRERSLRDHMKLRHTENNNLPKCNICNKTFLYESIVKRHMSLRHSQEATTKLTKHPKGFLCETCGSTFTQKHTLKLHMNVHLNIKPHVCNHCGKKFTWLNALEYHERTHTGERPYSCHLCSQRFKTPSDLKRHQVVHTKEKPFACSLCPKKFSQGTTLKTHINKIHGKPDRVPTEQTTCTFDQIISLIPILPDVQITINDNSIEFLQDGTSCVATL